MKVLSGSRAIRAGVRSGDDQFWTTLADDRGAERVLDAEIPGLARRRPRTFVALCVASHLDPDAEERAIVGAARRGDLALRQALDAFAERLRGRAIDLDVLRRLAPEVLDPQPRDEGVELEDVDFVLELPTLRTYRPPETSLSSRERRVRYAQTARVGRRQAEGRAAARAAGRRPRARALRHRASPSKSKVGPGGDDDGPPPNREADEAVRIELMIPPERVLEFLRLLGRALGERDASFANGERTR